MMIFIEQPKEAAYHEAADTLSEKLARQGGEGAVIVLSEEEMTLMREAHIIGLSDKSNPVELMELKKGGKYLALCDKRVNLDDLIRLLPILTEIDDIRIGIVRIKESNND